jgi:uncharacterized protein (DUF488 family)
MILTIGYYGMKLDALVARLDYFDVAELWDVRGKPQSRKADFRRPALERALGTRYRWMGAEGLGNYAGNETTPAGLARVRQASAGPRPIMLMCMEEAPGDCHRHMLIASGLLPSLDVTHIYRDELVTAGELERALRSGDGSYACETFDLGKARR